MSRELVERARYHAEIPMLQQDHCCIVSRQLMRDLAAALEASAPEGWVLVPREPTVAMMKAGELGWCHHDHGNLQGRATQCYRAMLAAAPKEPTDG